MCDCKALLTSYAITLATLIHASNVNKQYWQKQRVEDVWA